MFLPTLAILAALFACNNERRTVADAPAAIEPRPVEAEAPSPAFGGPATADSLFLSLERTPCFGTCKAYRIEVYRSGYATYNGRSNMEKLGMYTTHVGADMMEALAAQAEAVTFFTMQDKYDAEVTDLPSTFLRIVANGKDKKVMGRVGQPNGFKNLVAFAEEQLLPLAWTPVATKP
jgi:Domain of unknown function (DUF6438)